MELLVATILGGVLLLLGLIGCVVPVLPSPCARIGSSARSCRGDFRKESMAEELKFPVVVHHRFIVNASAHDDAVMKRLFDGFILSSRLLKRTHRPAEGSRGNGATRRPDQTHPRSENGIVGNAHEEQEERLMCRPGSVHG